MPIAKLILLAARRKQGGGQSANDSAKGAAHSAGATLRRYGEQALQEDIRNLLVEWVDEIDVCERIWMRASGKTRKIFWDYKDAPLSKDDNRLRGFPFPTRRPVSLVFCLLHTYSLETDTFRNSPLH
jgi:hypothetical protein